MSLTQARAAVKSQAGYTISRYPELDRRLSELSDTAQQLPDTQHQQRGPPELAH